MTRAACSFRKSDVRRAVEAAKAAGLAVKRIEVGGDGKIAVIVDQNGNNKESETGENPWDQVYADDRPL
jgi:hypothetical protein